MADIVVFGLGDHAEQALYYLTEDSPHRVVAFTVTDSYRKSDTLFGLPLVAFEEIAERFPPGEVSMILPMSGRRMNRMRADFCAQAKAKGYSLASYISSRAMINRNQIGDNCMILENSVIMPFVTIGDNVMIRGSAQVSHHSVVGNHVFICPGTVIGGRCTIGDFSYLAPGAIIDTTVSLGEGTLAGTCTMIRKSTEPWGIYTGRPGRRHPTSSADYEFT